MVVIQPASIPHSSCRTFPTGARQFVVHEALETILREADAARTFSFEPGQIQYVNNFALGHRRSAFEDAPDEGYKRHLVRLWLRDYGRRGYGG